MIICLEAPLPEEHRPHKGDRERDQKPAEFIGIGLQFIEHQPRVFAPFLDQRFVDRLHTRAAEINRRAAAVFPLYGCAHIFGCRYRLRGGRNLLFQLGSARITDWRGSELSARFLQFALGPFQPILDLKLDIITHIKIGRRGDANRLKHGEHQKDAEEEHRHRRDEFRPLAINIAAGQPPRLDREQRQSAPQFPIEMEHAMHQIMANRFQASMDRRLLSAAMAMPADQRGAAIEAFTGGGILRGITGG